MSTRAVAPTVAAPTAVVMPVQKPMLQRSCDCGQHTGGGECEECKKKKKMPLQRYASGSSDLPSSSSLAPPIVHEVLGSSGESLDPETRGFMEPRFRQDFSQVRVHTDPRAAESAHAIGAQAYTVGRHLVFGAGRFAPATNPGRQLLAHELTHVVQQRNVGSCAVQQSLDIGSSDDPFEIEADETARRVAEGKEPGEADRRLSDAPARLQRAATAPEPAAAGPTTPNPQVAMLLVDDDTKEVNAGQMRKGEFLDKLQAAVCAAADEELAAVGRTAKGCPYIERWIGHLRSKSSQFVERAIRKYAPGSAGVTKAEEYIPPVAARVRRGVARWAKTGEITEVPDELKGQLQVANVANAMDRLFSGVGGVLGAVGSAVATGVRAVGGLLAKERAGGIRDADDPLAIQGQLGSGHPLDGAIRSRMETALGADFARVRIHTDSTAASLSTRVNARAFTIGSDVAFGAAEYQPGTLIGDALLAHELAHVMQQQDGSSSLATMSPGAVQNGALEDDADVAAVKAVASSWGKASSTVRELGKNAMPRLRSGLRLQRCSKVSELDKQEDVATKGKETVKEQPVAEAGSELKPESKVEECCCCVNDLKIDNPFITKLPAMPEYGEPFEYHGHIFTTVADLSYKGQGTKRSCTLEWWEKTDRGYTLVPSGVWTNLAGNPNAKSIQDWYTKRKEPCPGQETIKWVDSPALGKAPGEKKNAQRKLEFRIVVNSGCDKCDVKSKRITAKQTLVMVDGKLDERKSKFEVPNPDDK